MFSAALIAAAFTAVTPQSPADPAPAIAALEIGADVVVQLDGRLNEEFWRRAVPADGFRQQDPDNGAPATEGTDVRIVFDAHRLVLGITCTDSEPSQLHGNQMQRDQPLASDDRFIVAIDTYLDGRTGYYFEINPSGAMGDALILPGVAGGATANNLNRSWDGIWTARVVHTPTGWTAEVEIPFRTLNFDPRAPAWGINFQRSVRRKNEESLWTAYARNQGVTFMAAAGRLVGLHDLSQGIGLDVRPYMAGSSTAAPGRGAPRAVNKATAGGDLFYNVTPGLRANVTVNTDFAETEVDQRQVNLTRFPLFFPEKRAFFLEGSSFFDFSREPGTTIVPFFSRRIGLDDRGVPQPITYGGKLTGQAGAFDVGVLQVGTRDTTVAPGEQFSVARIRRRFLAQSYLGAIYTRRAGNGGPDRQTAGMDFAVSTAHFRGAQVLELSGFWLTTSPAAGGAGGSAFGLRLNYPNDPLNLRIALSDVQPGYDPATGFVDRRGYRRVNPGARFIRHTSSNPIVRRFSFEADVDLLFDPEGRLETRRPDLQVMRLDLQSGDGFELHVLPMLERLPRPFAIFSGVTLPVGSVYTFLRRQYRFQTTGRRTVALTGQYEDGSFYSGTRRQLTSTVSVRPHAGWLLGVTGDYNDVDLREGRFTTTLWRGDVSTQFGPWISLAQTLQYDTVTKGLGWQARFRWIRKPGDDVYFVYTHNWIDGQALATFDRKAAVKVAKTFRF